MEAHDPIRASEGREGIPETTQTGPQDKGIPLTEDQGRRPDVVS